MDKIIFAGPVGAGKTTAIGAISETPPVGTDVACTDDTIALKQTTTVAMDYSYITLQDGTRIHLYGTPGQDRFDFMWQILTKGGIGLVLLINKDHPQPLQQLEFYLNAFAEFIKETGVVIGLTKSDLNDHHDIASFQNYLYEREQVYPVFDVDARSSDDVKILVHALLAVLNH
ncbi:MAG: GTP-binding protein [Gammaproteobacteria bacterium]|nr:GTP-binding protein [Gammaproteobacteria bacterium]